MNDCSNVINFIDERIFKNKFVVFEASSDEKNEIFSIVENVKIKPVFEDFSFISKEKDFNTEKMKKCIYDNYGNGRNIKQISRNVLGYDNSIGSKIVLFPMIFINGMMIGSVINLKRIGFYSELDILF